MYITFAIQYNRIQYNRIQCNRIQYNRIQCNTIQYNRIQCNRIQYNRIQYNRIQCNNAIQYNTIHTSIWWVVSSWKKQQKPWFHFLVVSCWISHTWEDKFTRCITRKTVRFDRNAMWDPTNRKTKCCILSYNMLWAYLTSAIGDCDMLWLSLNRCGWFLDQAEKLWEWVRFGKLVVKCKERIEHGLISSFHVNHSQVWGWEVCCQRFLIWLVMLNLQVRELRISKHPMTSVYQYP